MQDLQFPFGNIMFLDYGDMRKQQIFVKGIKIGNFSRDGVYIIPNVIKDMAKLMIK